MSCAKLIQTITIEASTGRFSDDNLLAEIYAEGSTLEECIKEAVIFWTDSDGEIRREAALDDLGGEFHAHCERIITYQFDSACMRRWEREQENARR